MDFKTREIVATVKNPGEPVSLVGAHSGAPSYGIAMSPDNKTLWVNSSVAGAVFIYSLPDLKLLGPTVVGDVPDWLTLTPVLALETKPPITLTTQIPRWPKCRWPRFPITSIARKISPKLNTFESWSGEERRGGSTSCRTCFRWAQISTAATTNQPAKKRRIIESACATQFQEYVIRKS